MQSLVFHRNSDVLVLQNKSQFFLVQEVDVPVAYELLEVPADVHHDLRVDFAGPEENANIEVVLIRINEALSVSILLLLVKKGRLLIRANQTRYLRVGERRGRVHPHTRDK